MPPPRRYCRTASSCVQPLSFCHYGSHITTQSSLNLPLIQPLTSVAIAAFCLVNLLCIAGVYYRGGNGLANMLKAGDGSHTASSRVIILVRNRIITAVTTTVLLKVFFAATFGAYDPTGGRGSISWISYTIGQVCYDYGQNTSISYVRYGARKKLGAKGYLDPSNFDFGTGKVATMATMTSTTTTQLDETPRGGKASGAVPVPAHWACLNKIWAAGFF